MGRYSSLLTGAKWSQHTTWPLATCCCTPEATEACITITYTSYSLQQNTNTSTKWSAFILHIQEVADSSFLSKIVYHHVLGYSAQYLSETAGYNNLTILHDGCRLKMPAFWDVMPCQTGLPDVSKNPNAFLFRVKALQEDSSGIAQAWRWRHALQSWKVSGNT